MNNFLIPYVSLGKRFKGGEMNEKGYFDDFIVGFDFGVGRVLLLVASWRWPWRWLLGRIWWRPRG